MAAITTNPPDEEWNRSMEEEKNSADVNSLRLELQSMNWKFLGLIRDEKGMQTLLDWLQGIRRFSPSNLQELELINLLDCSTLMVSFALHRRESRGSHHREDFPTKNPEWTGLHTIMRNGRIELISLEG